MKQNRLGITSRFYEDVQRQGTSRQHVGTSCDLYSKDTPKLTDETEHTDIDTILICADPAFHNGVQSGRAEFIALAFENREIVAQDVENALQWAMYDTLRPAIWRYGYVCGWNEEFYKYAMQKREEQANAPKLACDERRER
ncbi:hypothetical protein [Ktedonobacter robiniae]|uniref:Uncharacterized protein n=1 Tax=Ktedonobacter robiniae TaxID=2778365 RepID=A0ABQ3UIJ6_9CHLR|nr:hypothetical protein [Ktedonobacter robiniae]GHO52503.1 hypothetical protein KSB_09780 [Ktedonobacter robiniae]